MDKIQEALVVHIKHSWWRLSNWISDIFKELHTLHFTVFLEILYRGRYSSLDYQKIKKETNILQIPGKYGWNVILQLFVYMLHVLNEKLLPQFHE